jgi:hypothetical protein
VSSARRTAVGAVGIAAGAVVAVLLAILGVFAVIFLFRTMASGIVDAIGDAIGGG